MYSPPVVRLSKHRFLAPFLLYLLRQGVYKYAASHDVALASACDFVGVLGSLDLRNQELKRLTDVLVVARARFGPCAPELLRQLAPVVLADLSLFRP